MGYRFFSLPGHRLTENPTQLPDAERIDASVPTSTEIVERAFLGSEYRAQRARDRIRQLLLADVSPRFGPPAARCGASAIFAQPPQDLPALLRLADQLENLAKEEVGERALAWSCHSCGTRYAVPLALVRSVSIKCERCGNVVELKVAQSLGEELLLDPFQGTVNHARRELAVFFREAMAHGWPVLVCTTE